MSESRLPAESAAYVPEAIGQSEEFLDFQEQVSRAARVDRPVLIVGERGTGKELAARRLHYLSARWEQPLVTLNCAALAPTLIEAELFGHEAGAFTGATRRRAGRFETADGGTIFLDEIANIPVEAQEKILRVVEYGVFERVGSAETIGVDVRIVGATNADLPSLAADGSFKQDLLDRLSFEVLFVPPLREREGDVMLLARHFAGRMALELGWDEVPTFGEHAREALLQHDWPGNVRQLKNVVERAVYRADSEVIEQIDFDPFRSRFAPTAPEPAEAEPAQQPTSPARPAVSLDKPLEQAVRELEIAMMRRALRQAKHNQKEAAKRLGLTYHQFRGRYRKYQDEL
ncbi:MAG: phage shock protein operon transcriptional activator [Candidatus Brocadiia bacterium]